MFGWDFDSLAISIQSQLSKVMYAVAHSEGVVSLSTMAETLVEEVSTAEVTADWDPGMLRHDQPRLTCIEFLTSDLVQKCVTTFECDGDAAMRSKDHKRAIVQYSTALSLNPSNRASLLVKRSNARGMLEKWEDALKDADEV